MAPPQRSPGASFDEFVVEAAQGGNVQPHCLGSVELEIKIAQLQHAYARPRHQRAAM
jgi:hypothetical protein